MDWNEVARLCNNNSPFPEIREFFHRGGNATITKTRDGNELYTTQVDYHIQGRELHRIFKVEVTPDYFLSITGELEESWGPSPIDQMIDTTSGLEFLVPPMSPEEIERLRRMLYDHMMVDFAGGTYETAAGIPGSLPPSPTKSEWREAATRSKEWLLEHLTDEQRADFESKKYFVVKGQKSGNSYRINTIASQMNIRLMPQDGAHGGRNLCVVSKDKNIPILDQVLMQKLMIETKEDEFLELAGVSRYSLEREARETELRLRYQQEMQAAQQHYADALRALDVEIRQTTNAIDNFNYNFRNRFGGAGPITDPLSYSASS